MHPLSEWVSEWDTEWVWVSDECLIEWWSRANRNSGTHILVQILQNTDHQISREYCNIHRPIKLIYFVCEWVSQAVLCHKITMYIGWVYMAVVPVLFLFCVACWFILRDASCFKVSPCSLSSCFVITFSIVITSLGEEGAGLCASRAFVCVVLVSFVIFSFDLGVGCWLWFVIVALPGLFY